MTKKAPGKSKQPDAQVKDWLIAGLDRCEIEQMAQAGGWQVRESQIDKLIAEVGEAMRTAGMTDHDAEVGRMIWRLNELFKRSLAVEDYKTALAVQKEIADRCGLAPTPPPEPLEEPGSPERAWSKTNLDELAAALEKHLARFGKESDDFITLIKKAGKAGKKKTIKRKGKK